MKVDEKKIKRLEESIKYLISKGEIDGKAPIKNIAAKMGRHKNNISSAISGDEKYYTKKFLIDFCATYGNVISVDWLWDGSGDMLIDETYKPTIKMLPSDFDTIPTKGYDKNVGKPYYNVDFEMGYDIMVNDQTRNPDYMINFTPYNKCDCWCNAHGDSMWPTISSGDVIAIKEVKDFSYLISGEIYAIVTKNDLRTIKRIRDNGDTITLIPDNKDYSEQVIEKDKIEKVFKVLGSVTMF